MRILIVAPGGYGDTLLLTPLLDAIRRLSPEHTIGLCMRERTRCVIDGTGLVDEFVDYPLALTDLLRFDVWCSMEGVNEHGASAKVRHAITNKFARFGLSAPDKPTVIYSPTEAELTAAKASAPRKANTRRIGIHLAASAANRTYPPPQLSKVMGSLYNEGHEIYIFGTPGSTEGTPVPERLAGRVRDLAKERLTFRESAAMLTTCDILVAPDSSLMHIMGALGGRCVALFGPIDWHNRTSTYPTVWAIQGRLGCDIAPCNFHQIGGRFFPENGPCFKTGRCEAMASIEPAQILDAVQRSLRSKP